jgi:hypothetical protein
MDILSLPTNTTFIMAESSAFFEAYRHVLEGLQEMMVKKRVFFYNNIATFCKSLC